MKKVSSIWLILVFIAGVSGFAVGTSHNRPRLAVNQYSLDLLLDSPDTGTVNPTSPTPTSPTPPPPPPPTSTNNDCNNDGAQDTPWDILNCRFNEYKDVKKVPYAKEIWNIREIIPETQQHKKVNVYYNTVTDEVVLVCPKLKCE